MSKHRTMRFPPCDRWLPVLHPCGNSAAGRGWHVLRRSRRLPPVVVLIADRAQRRSVEREIRRGLRRLPPALGAPLPAELAIIVQQVVSTDRQLAGCSLLGQHPGGRRFALVRLALEVNGRRLTIDELLVSLAEQCVGVLFQHSPSVLIPVELERDPTHAATRTPPAESRRPAPLRLDPLAPHPNGAVGEEQSA